MRNMLELKEVCVEYGATRAVRSVTLNVSSTATVAVLGSNGAGKSSLLSSIAGQVSTRSGTCALDGDIITGCAADEIARKGVSLVPEGRNIFKTLTVEENLRVGAASRNDKSGVQSDLAEMYKRFPVLFKYRAYKADLLSGGEQQQLAIGRALMARPRVLLLDEPSLGLSPVMMDRVYQTISDLKELGMTIVLVEQFAERALEVADWAIIMKQGSIVAEHPASELKSKPEILESAYFSGEAN
ncbi:ABC transporter ATP-binding protein [Sinorhizobium sp. BJ1]|uniref:ABC transporter ATP-binding protein n=1 Tax=Sinorhizobium sp. BJ1 TaxID=2035455 RepID=UPI000BE86CF5|nr:ABC transporter ATP-binding protein [Sinorhizobium sp. BJ1]PDT80831.1 ABC transporter ATP-binding protein [Sinorhizobium sp. BJ1]